MFNLFDFSVIYISTTYCLMTMFLILIVEKVFDSSKWAMIVGIIGYFGIVLFFDVILKGG